MGRVEIPKAKRPNAKQVFRLLIPNDPARPAQYSQSAAHRFTKT
jgi:hypothetical protein